MKNRIIVCDSARLVSSVNPAIQGKITKLPSKERGPEEITLVGRDFITVQDAALYAAQRLQKGDPGIPVGGIRVNSETNVAIEGETRSGKTTALYPHLAEVCERIRKGSNEKVILFDANGDAIPFVYAHAGDDANVIIMNSNDQRCSAWAAGEDITTRSLIRDLSNTFIPDQPNDTQFFNLAARGTLSAVMDCYLLGQVKSTEKNTTIRPWTLRDVACATMDPDRLRSLFSQYPVELNRYTRAYLDRPNQDVFSTIQAQMENLFTVAALWDKRPPFSLRSFLNSPKGGFLILSADNENRSTVLALNRLLIERAARMLLNGPQVRVPRYWFFLDEFTKLGKLDSLRELIKEGLKRGVRVVLTLQTREDVIVAYGKKEEASVLMSECTTHITFRHGDASADLASQAIGQHKILRKLRSRSSQISTAETNQTTVSHNNFSSSGCSGGQPSSSSGSGSGTAYTTGTTVTVGVLYRTKNVSNLWS